MFHVVVAVTTKKKLQRKLCCMLVEGRCFAYYTVHYFFKFPLPSASWMLYLSKSGKETIRYIYAAFVYFTFLWTKCISCSIFEPSISFFLGCNTRYPFQSNKNKLKPVENSRKKQHQPTQPTKEMRKNKHKLQL